MKPTGPPRPGETVWCTTGGHEKVPAVGEAQVDVAAPGWFPFCRSCLLRFDPPQYWWSVDLDVQIPVGSEAGLVLDGFALINAIEEKLLQNSAVLQSLHHTFPRLDANARRAIAELALDALFEVLASP